VEKIILVQNSIKNKIADIKNNPALKKDSLGQALFREMCEYFDSLCSLTAQYEKEKI